MHQHDTELEESYIDWFFLFWFKKGPNFWRTLTDDQVTAYISLTQEKEKETWKRFGKMLGG